MKDNMSNLTLVSLSAATLYLSNVSAQDLSRPVGSYGFRFDSQAANTAQGEISIIPSHEKITQEKSNLFEVAKETSKDAELETIFNGLAKNWREATQSYSLNMRRYAHPTYQAMMVALGKEEPKDVIPLILSELQQRPDIWFEALKVFAKDDPARNSKSFDNAVAAWLEWGKKEHYI